MLSEISQTDKYKYCMISLICGVCKNQIHRKGEQIGVARGGSWGIGKGGATWVKVIKRYKLPVIR